MAPRTRGGLFLSTEQPAARSDRCAASVVAGERAKAMPAYHPQRIEPKWQAEWERNKTFRAIDLDPSRPKLYILDMFPYPSGAGLHVGHPEGYTATDIVCRYKRMRGYNVLHPMGWDAFGLPAEQYAVQTNTHPRITTQANIDTFRRQIKSLGFSYDWDREVDTTDPDYYKWTQWIFLKIYDTWYDPEFEWTDRHGKARKGKGRPIAELPIPPGTEDPDAYRDARRLAYRAVVAVNWCPELGTVLANEEVIDGKSERGGYPVVRMPLTQWMLRITAYAERLDRRPRGRRLAAPDQGHAAQLGRPQRGGRGRFPRLHWLERKPPTIRVYTTRPDTLFGATYMVLAPEHPLVDQITSDAQRAERREVSPGRGQQERPRPHRPGQDQDRRVHGGLCDEPGQRPVDPGLDRRLRFDGIRHRCDHGRAGPRRARLRVCPDVSICRSSAWSLPDLAQADAPLEQAEAEPGVAVHSRNAEISLDGLPTAEAKVAITAWLEKRGLGKKTVNYKLRDWLFSRQRYWGEPFPVVLDSDDRTQAIAGVGAAGSLARAGRFQADRQARAAA